MTELASRMEASEYTLAAIIFVPAYFDELVGRQGLRPKHMATRRHASILRSIITLVENGEQIDPDGINLKARLEAEAAAGRGPWVGQDDPRAAVDELVSAPVPGLSGAAAWVELLKREHEWDRRGRALTEAGEAIRERDETAFETAIARLDETTPETDDDVITAEQLGSEFIDWYASETTGAISTPFRQLDDLLAGGWLPGATTIVAAWSSMGKSVLVDQCAAHATSVDRTSCVYTNEMVRATRTARTISRMTGVPFRRIMRKQLEGDEYSLVLGAAQRLPFPIKECAGWSADDIARHIRKHRWDVWVVDLVTRIPARDTADWDRVSGCLTDVAVKTETHGILVCQLNQERNKSLIKPPPVQRDLRNTGSWYNDATNVVFLHRDQEEVLDNTGAPTGVPKVKDDGIVRVEKSRNDEPGGFGVTFNPKRMQFEPLENYRLEAVAA